MASFDKWDPYETSQKRDFLYRPNSSTPGLRPLTSKAYRNPYDPADPVGVTAYSEDFCWKPPSKPACIRTGSASGNTRNNPHPGQVFMVWRLSPGLKLCENPPSEDQIRKVLSAQYRSIYRTDFLGTPQGTVRSQAVPAPHKHSDVQTEMRSNYRTPALRAELQGNMSRYGCNARHHVAIKGIVPSVVPKHILIQENKKQVTTYDKHFGGKSADLSPVFRSLQPDELQNFCKRLPEKEKVVVQSCLQRPPGPSGLVKEVKGPLRILEAPPVLDRVSRWPGPL